MSLKKSLIVVACGLALMPVGALAADSRAVEFAKLGVQLAGHNYATYSACRAPADKLRAFREKSRARFPLVGAGFDGLFAAGQADGTAYWRKAVADLGEDKARAAACPNSLKRLDISLSRK